VLAAHVDHAGDLVVGALRGGDHVFNGAPGDADRVGHGLVVPRGLLDDRGVEEAGHADAHEVVVFLLDPKGPLGERGRDLHRRVGDPARQAAYFGGLADPLGVPGDLSPPVGRLMPPRGGDEPGGDILGTDACLVSSPTVAACRRDAEAPGPVRVGG
jgi:hypothetical protein